MTISELTVNGKTLGDLTSKETTELITALFAHRKTLNAARRQDTVEKLEARLAKLKSELAEAA